MKKCLLLTSLVVCAAGANALSVPALLLADTHISQSTPALNFGGSPALRLDTPAGQQNRILVHPNLSAFPGVAGLRYAELHMNGKSFSGTSGPFTTEGYRVPSLWNENQANWFQRITATGWAAAGGDGLGTTGVPFALPYINSDGYMDPTTREYVYDLRQLVIDWAGGAPDRGITMIPASISDASFFSRECNQFGFPHQVEPFVVAGYGPCALTSYFGGSREGWGLATFPFGGPYDVPIATAAADFGVFGNPTGSLTRVDGTAGFSEFFVAPQKYTGDMLDYLGGRVRFNLFTNGVPNNNLDRNLTLVDGAGNVLVAPLPPAPIGAWKLYDVDLVPGNFRIGNIGGAIPTAAQFNAVLGNVARMLIPCDPEFAAVEQTFVDSVEMLPKNLIRGHITLQQFVPGPGDRFVALEFLNGGGATIGSDIVKLQPDGSYESVATGGAVGVRAKAIHWLSSVTTCLPALNPANVDLTLRNGDCDNDNVVSIFDYIEISNAFDSVVGDALYSVGADLDGDGAVSIFDYIIMSEHFDQMGA